LLWILLVMEATTVTVMLMAVAARPPGPRAAVELAVVVTLVHSRGRSPLPLLL
jgi:hypothetical protein